MFVYNILQYLKSLCFPRFAIVRKEFLEFSTALAKQINSKSFHGITGVFSVNSVVLGEAKKYLGMVNYKINEKKNKSSKKWGRPI